MHVTRKERGAIDLKPRPRERVDSGAVAPTGKGIEEGLVDLDDL